MPKEPGEIDVLIGTDCISEGQNLQDCDYVINYDIHWNPVRIIQRFGRIDRIGSTNATIQLVNFWPDITPRRVHQPQGARREPHGDRRPRGHRRRQPAHPGEPATPRSARSSSASLQDEVIELEDVRTGVSITDLGLNDFRMDLLNYMKEYGDLASSPKGLHAAVPADPSMGLQPGVIFALRSVDEQVDDQPPQPPAPVLPDLPRRRRAASSPTTPRSSSSST